MIKVVAFDLDDTLWAVKPVLIRAESLLNQWLAAQVPELVYDMAGMREALAPELIAAEPDLRHRLTRFRRRLIELGMVRSGLTAERAVSLTDQAMEVFLAARHEVNFFDGALEAISSIAPRYQLGALTNGNADIARLGLGEHFGFAFSAEEMAEPKPAPDLFHAALEHTGVKPEEMVYVGDDPIKDVDAAKRVGLGTIWLRNDLRPGPGETTPDRTLASLAHLPQVLQDLEQAG